MKAVLKEIIPPIAWNMMRQIVGRKGLSFEGNYSTWQAALDAAGGYDKPAILERVRSAALNVKDGKAVFERDSVCFYNEEYRWSTLACLLRVAAENGGRLRVLDFGGSLGSFWFQHKKHFQNLSEVRWAVVEQPHYVRCGNEEFANDTLEFHETIEECLESGSVDVIFVSSVLQYLPEPYVWLQRFAKSGVRYLLLDRTPFIDVDQDRLTVQHVPPQIYKASYPAWFFSRKGFMKDLKKAGYSFETEFSNEDDVGIGNYRGMLLVRD